MLVASSSPVKFSRIVFLIVKICAKFDWSCTAKTISISRCESLEIEPFYRKLSSRKRGNSSSVFHRISLKYSNDQRGCLKSCGERNTELRAITTQSYKQPHKGFGWGSHHGRTQTIELRSITSPRSGFEQFFGYFCLSLCLWPSFPCNYLMASKNEAECGLRIWRIEWLQTSTWRHLKQGGFFSA